jgi:hypothetical protein
MVKQTCARFAGRARQDERYGPCSLRPGGAGLLFPLSARPKGTERRTALRLGCCLSAGTLLAKESAHRPALHRGVLTSHPCGHPAFRSHGPRFRLKPWREVALARRPAGRSPSAGSQQGPIVVPSGAPWPPECMTHVRSRSRAPHPAPPSKRLATTPFGTDQTIALIVL